MPQTPPIEDAYIDEIIKAADAYKPGSNKTQGIKLRELIKRMRDRMEQGSTENAKFEYVAPDNNGIINL